MSNSFRDVWTLRPMPPAEEKPSAQPVYRFSNPTPKPPGTNGMSIAALVLSLVLPGVGSILAIVFGTIGRRQTGESGQNGHTMATWGVWLGWIGLIACVILGVLIGIAVHHAQVAQANYCGTYGC